MTPATAATVATSGVSAPLVSQGSYTSTWGATGETFGPVMKNVTASASSPPLDMAPFPSGAPAGMGHNSQRPIADPYHYQYQSQPTQQGSAMAYNSQSSEQSPLFFSVPSVPPFPLGVQQPITHNTPPFRTHEPVPHYASPVQQPLQPHLSSSLAESSATATSASGTIQQQQPLITHLSPPSNPYTTRAQPDLSVDATRYPSDGTSSQTVASTFHTDNDSDISAPVDVVDATFSSTDPTRSFSTAVPAASSAQPQGEPAGSFVVLVQFKWGRQAEFLHNTGDLTLGTHVVVSADRGRDMGMVVETRVAGENDKQKASTIRQSIVRVATEPEMQRWRVMQPKEEAAAKKMAQRVLSKAGITMKIVHAEYQFDMKKVTFHFTSQSNHPDFRQVLDPLFGLLRARIWFSRYTNTELDKRNRGILKSMPEYAPAHSSGDDEENDENDEESSEQAPTPPARHSRSHRGRRVHQRDHQMPARYRP